MFTRFPGPLRLRGGLERRAARTQAWAKAALSLRALAGVAPPVLAIAYEPGAWRFDGYKATPDYPAAVTGRIAREQMFDAMSIDPRPSLISRWRSRHCAGSTCASISRR
jgi:hypothetical protein